MCVVTCKYTLTPGGKGGHYANSGMEYKCLIPKESKVNSKKSKKHLMVLFCTKSGTERVKLLRICKHLSFTFTAVSQIIKNRKVYVTAVHIFFKCILSYFAYFTDHVVHLLQI
jgi:hypothetical protein